MLNLVSFFRRTSAQVEQHPRFGRLGLITFSLAIALSAAGCSEKNSPPVSAAASSETNAVISEVSHAPTYDAPPQTTAIALNGTEPDLAQMNRELRKWLMRNHRRPKNFEEFAASANVQFPPPPAGKKYSIDSRMHVVLIKQ